MSDRRTSKPRAEPAKSDRHEPLPSNSQARMVVMLAGDHFVWPTLVGNSARLPFLVALIGIFGGLQVFGLIGLFVGPVIMAALLTVWREWLGHADSAERATR
jgi:predicted PurR-regulated permease PerM